MHFAKSSVDLRTNKSIIDFELKKNIKKYNYIKNEKIISSQLVWYLNAYNYLLLFSNFHLPFLSFEYIYYGF